MSEESNSTETFIADLHDEIEQGLTLHYTGDDTGYTAVMKNKYNKYEYICDLEPPEYFSTFEELIRHLGDIDELDGWEVDVPPSEEEMIHINTLRACIYSGDEKGAQLIASQWMLKRLRTCHGVNVRELCKTVARLVSVQGRKEKPSAPEWRLEYMHLEMEGEHEKADCLLNAKIAEGISKACAAITW